MPSWLPDHMKARVERCRALLADPSSEHHGSADMECYVQYADLMVALHEVALDDRGQARADLSPGEQLQLCALFLLAQHKHPVVNLGLDPAVVELLVQSAKALPQRWAAVALAVLLLLVLPDTGGLAAPYEDRLELADAVEGILDGSPEASAALPDDMAAAGCSHTLTAGVLKQVALYRVVHGALEVLAACKQGRAAPRQVVRGARRAADSLVALRPGWPRYLQLRAEVAMATGDGPAAAAGDRAALEAAQAQRAYFWAALACGNLVGAMLGGAEGERFDPRRVQELLDEGERMLRLSSPWTAPHKKALHDNFKDLREQLRESAAASGPGASTAPVLGRHCWTSSSPNVFQRCDGCGGQYVELKKCSRCRTVAYCSRECQVRHWKEGGHKRDCKSQ